MKKLVILISTILSFLVISCNVKFYDGFTIDHRNSSINIDGYNTTHNRVDVKAQNPVTGIFEDIGSTLPTDNNILSFSDTPLFEWKLNTTIPLGYWQRGERGYFSKITAASDASQVLLFKEDIQNCYGLNGSNFVVFNGNCPSNQNICYVCSDDFIAVNDNRRLGCPRRKLMFKNSDADIGLVSPNDSITRTYRFKGFNKISLTADKLSFVDIFNSSFDPEGNEFGFFVRLKYTEESNSHSINNYNVNDIAEGHFNEIPSATVAQIAAPWGGGNWERFYDCGECSTIIKWREILTGIIDFVYSPKLTLIANSTTPEVKLANPTARTVLTPIFKSTTPDAFRITQSFIIDAYPFGVFFEAHATLQCEVSLFPNPVDGKLSATIKNLIVKPDNTVSDLAQKLVPIPTITATMQTAIDSIVTKKIREQFPISNSFPIKRSYIRPEGYEFVLAETKDDPYYSLFNTAGMCNRNLGNHPIIGYFMSLFDPPLPSDGMVFGDEERH